MTTSLPAGDDPVEDVEFSGEDWYGEDFGPREFVRCSFKGIDLTECRTAGTVFTDCSFVNTRLNASRHEGSAFLNSGFRQCDLFDARFVDCKLVGSSFERCTLRPLRVEGGDWSFVGLAGAELTSTHWDRVRMRETDLTRADLTGATATRLNLRGAVLELTVLAGADLRGSDLSSLDPRQARLLGAIVQPEQCIALAMGLGLEVRDDEFRP